MTHRIHLSRTASPFAKRQPTAPAGAALALVIGLGGCSESTTSETLFAPAPCTAGMAALPVLGCEAGIPPERCAAGFEADGNMGCNPLLPEEGCPAGQLAVPGDEACRPVASCGDGTWGDITTEADTQFVDRSYSGGASDGSDAAPWTTIAEGISAAADGAVVAVAAGTYAEDLTITGKAVRLWGRCPEMVEIAGSDAVLAAILIGSGAATTQIRSLAVTGQAGGIRIEGSQQVVLEQVWIHDTADRGVTLQTESGPVEATVRDSLIESATVLGVQVVGAVLTAERIVVRSTAEEDPGGVGQAVSIQPHPTGGEAANATIRSSVLEGNHTAALMAVASSATIEGSLIRNTLPSQLSSRDGIGIIAQTTDAGARAHLTVTSSVVDDNYARGIVIVGSDATIEATHVRDTAPQQWDSRLGEGIAVLDDGTERSTVTIRQSLVERARQSGIVVRGSDAEIISTFVRDIEPREEDDAFGRGIAIMRESEEAPGATATVQDCRVENTFTFGVYVADAAVSMSGTLIQGTKVQAMNGDFGDGVGVATLEPQLGTPATLEMSGSRFDDNARAGIVTFGANLGVEQTTLNCNNGEMLGRSQYFGKENPYAYEDRGDNVCGCGTSRNPCEVVAF